MPASLAPLWPAGWDGADVVFLDCDSTLSRTEGVDALARRRGVDVAELTARAMAGEVPVESVYRARLERIEPDAADLAWLAEEYAATCVAGAEECVAALQRLGVACHVVSGGLLPAVAPFAAGLGIPAERVHAVPYPLGEADPVSVACAHPLARDGGKPEVVRAVCASGPSRARRLLVGDGVSDLEAASAVGLFIGFGGVAVRARVRDEAAVFLVGPGLEDLAALALGPRRLSALEAIAPRLYDCALRTLASPVLRPLREP